MMLKNLMLVSLLNIGKLLLQSSIAIVIALFTTPDRFGLIGFSLPLVTFLILIGTAGIAPAIIARPDLRNVELGAALTLVLAISGCLLIGIWIAAPFLERGARLPGLSVILSVLGMIVIPANVAETLRAAMERQLLYQRLVKIELMALLVAVVAAILAAFGGVGIWALVLYHLTLQIARVGGMAVTRRERIDLNLRWGAIRPMMFFGGLTLVANLCNFAARNTDNVLIGGNFGARAVGLYAIAYQLMTLPLIAIAWPASNLLLATLKRLAPDDDSGFARTVRDMLTFTAALAFPIAAWLSVAFPWLASHMLPARWRDLAPLLGMLAPAGALQSLAAFTGAVLLARDRARLNVAISAINCVILVAGFIAGMRFGFRGFVAIYVILSSVLSIGQVGLLIRIAGLGAGRMLSGLAPAAIAAAGVSLGFAALSRLGGGWPLWAAMNAVAAAALSLLYVRCYPHLFGDMLERMSRRRPLAL